MGYAIFYSMNKTKREKIISVGVKNLKEFGYPSVTKENILTDYCYKKVFLNSLKSVVFDLRDFRHTETYQATIDLIKEIEE